MKKFTLKELADLTNSKYVGNKNYIVAGVNTLESSEETDVSFLANLRYVEKMKNSKAGIICISDSLKIEYDKNYLIAKDPSKVFQKIAEIILSATQKSGFSGTHPTAVVHDTAKIGKNVTICPNAVIDENVTIGDHTFIAPFVFVGPNSKIGANCLIHSHSVIREGCIIKDRVILQPGAVIGSCGFGYIQDKDANHVKLEQIGNVILEDDVEIGANSTIDRARFKSTIIKKGTKIDNLVQIAHNVEIGEKNIIAAQTGIAGSAKTGENVMMGGQAGVLGHVEIGKNVLIATRSGASKSLLKSGKYRGSPAIPIQEYSRQEVYLRRIKKYVDDLKELQEELKNLKLELKISNN